MRALLFATAALLAGISSARSDVMALELWINGVCTHHTVRVEMDEGRFLLSRQALSGEGIALPKSAGDTVALGQDTEIRATLDAVSQRLLLTAPAKALAPQVFDLRPAEPHMPDAASTGLIFDYDLSAQANDLRDIAGSGSLGLSATAALFSPLGVLRSSGFGQLFAGRAQGARLDSAFLIDDPGRIRRWSVGDAISGGLDWSRPVRFAGLQLASDYTLRPDLVTMPLPQFFGDTAVPASVDVFVGAAKVFEADIDPGPFELRNLPIVTGASTATVVVRDALGRQSQQTIALYDSGDLLAPGLDVYSLEAGALRRDYGVSSFGYGDAFASGTLRHGATDTLTLQAHGEASRDVQVLGGGLVFALEPFATLGVDLAGSESKSQGGTQVSFNLQGQWDRFSFFGDYRSASRFYGDVASREGAPILRREVQLGLSASLDRFGALSLSSVDQDMSGSGASRLIVGSYSLGFDNHFLTLTGFYDRVTGSWYSGFTFNILLGERNIAAAAGQASRDGSSITASYEHEGDPDGGIGTRAAATAGQDAGLDLQGVWYGESLTADGELSLAHDTVGVRAGLTGSLVALGGSVHAARQSDNAVALVQTGAPGVRVYRENREVAVSDADGEALVPGLVPFAANRIGVEANDYPLSTVVAESERIVVPPRYGGVVVDLAPARRNPVLVVVRLENGLFPPSGARAHVAGEDAVVGRGGKLFIADLKSEGRVTIDLPEGRCRLFVVPPQPSSDIPKLGPLLCRRVDADAP